MQMHARVLSVFMGVAATVGIAASVALAYGPSVPPGAAPAPKVGAGTVQNSAAPQPVKKTPVSPNNQNTLTYSAPSSNPKSPTTLNVTIPPNTFTQSGSVTLNVSNSQNLQTLQTAVGKTESVLTAFSLNSSAKSTKPMIVSVSSSDLFFGKFSVFAVRPNGNGKGYHFVYVKAKLVHGQYVFPANRNELYVLVRTNQSSNG